MLRTGLLLLSLLIVKISLTQQKQLGFALQHKPVTHLRFNDDSSKLQFAIISDLWGGNRPGIFEDALVKLELLQPQFVISVGDLIDGKTHDTILIDKQWKEFSAKVQSLSMPFFYVPGNHDIEYPIMEKEWIKRFGTPYYYFVYKNVLFLSVNTQDGGVSGVKDAQIQYFKKAIAENANVRWTFIFMHRPVWQGKGDKQEGYEKIEAFLKGRNYTLFSGHHHTYLNVIKNGQKHFVLGTTGGGIELRGEKFGEYDHVTMVSLPPNGEPHIVNLKLDGIIKEDVVNEKTFPVTQSLINQDWISVSPIVLPTQFPASISSEINFRNPTQYPLMVNGSLPQLPGYTITPTDVNLIIPPKTNQKQTVTIATTDKSNIDLASLSFLDVQLNGTYQVDKIVYQLPAKQRIRFEWETVLPGLPNAKTIAADQFNNYDSAGFITLYNPELLNKWYWYGTNDCLVKFRILHDANSLYLAAFIKDDQLVTGDNQDVLYVNVDDKNGNAGRINIQPDLKNPVVKIEGKSGLAIKDVQVTSLVNADGQQKYIIQLPLAKIIKPGNIIRINIGYRDQDNYPEKENSTLYWKPVWGSLDDYKNSGTFLIK